MKNKIILIAGVVVIILVSLLLLGSCNSVSQTPTGNTEPIPSSPTVKLPTASMSPTTTPDLSMTKLYSSPVWPTFTDTSSPLPPLSDGSESFNGYAQYGL